MAILVRSGRTVLANALLQLPMHLAWGEGDPAWDTEPVAEPNTATALVAEVGRRTLTEFRYCMNEADFIVREAGPPPAGTDMEDWIAANQGEIPDGKLLVVPTGRYVDIHPEESNEVYVRFAFDYEDGASPPRTIREVGVFVGSAMRAGLPAGQRYFPPGDVADPGRLLALQRDPKLVRAGNVRQAYEFVLVL